MSDNFEWTQADDEELFAHYAYAHVVHPWPEHYPDEEKIRAAENELGEVAREMIKGRPEKEASEWLDLAAIGMEGFKAAMMKAKRDSQEQQNA